MFEERRNRALEYLRAMRLYQWVKNLLVSVPLVADLPKLGNTLLAFLAFSLYASSVYFLKDLFDLGADRRHATKKHRPFATGTLPIAHGALLITRYTAIALIPIMVFALIYGRPLRDKRTRSGLLIFVAAAAVFLLPHFALMLKVFGNPFYNENWEHLAFKLYGVGDWSYYSRIPLAASCRRSSPTPAG